MRAAALRRRCEVVGGQVWLRRWRCLQAAEEAADGRVVLLATTTALLRLSGWLGWSKRALVQADIKQSCRTKTEVMEGEVERREGKAEKGKKTKKKSVSLFSAFSSLFSLVRVRPLSVQEGTGRSRASGHSLISSPIQSGRPPGDFPSASSNCYWRGMHAPASMYKIK